MQAPPIMRECNNGAVGLETTLEALEPAQLTLDLHTRTP